jgi:hypothetical protein
MGSGGKARAGGKAVNLHDVADVATIIGGLALLISVLLLLFELRENNRLTRAANNQALVELSSPFNMGLIQDRNMAELYVRGSEKYHEMDEVDQYRYRSLVIWWLIVHENIYYQWRRRLLDNRSFKPWASDLRMFIRLQNLQMIWGEIRDLLQDQFAAYIDRILAGDDDPSGIYTSLPPRRDDQQAKVPRAPV